MANQNNVVMAFINKVGVTVVSILIVAAFVAVIDSRMQIAVMNTMLTGLIVATGNKVPVAVYSEREQDVDRRIVAINSRLEKLEDAR